MPKLTNTTASGAVYLTLQWQGDESREVFTVAGTRPKFPLESRQLIPLEILREKAKVYEPLKPEDVQALVLRLAGTTLLVARDLQPQYYRGNSSLAAGDFECILPMAPKFLTLEPMEF